jgi:TolB-like protein
MLLRMGIDVCGVIIGRDDLYGRGVNLAARLMSLAAPGEIVVSARALSQLTPVLDADVEDLGDCYVKNVEEPVRAFRIGPPGPQAAVRPGPALQELRPVLAVIPFAVRGDDSGGALGDILAEEMIRSLGRSQEVSVISRLSTTAFRGRDLSLSEISAHLRADYVVSGVCTICGGDIVLDAELAEARSGRVVWSETLRDRVAGIVSGEQHLVNQAIVEISGAVTSRELQRARSQPLPTLENYTLLMGAIALMHRLSARDFNEAREMLETIVSRATHQPIAQAWLARWHVLRVQQGWSTDVMEDAHRALELTKRALDSDPESSLALAMDGFVNTNLLKRFDVARERYDLAISTHPNDSLALLLRGTMHAFCDEGEQAVQDTEHALTLSPFDPHRFFYDSLAASANITAGRYERAMELARRSLRANRTHTSTWRVLTVAQWQLGFNKEACESAQELMRLEPTLTVSGYLKRMPSASFSIGKKVADILQKAGVPLN